MLRGDGQLDTAERTGSRAINLLPEEGEEIWICLGHRVLGQIYQSKGKIKKAVHHFEVALRIASSLNVAHQLFWVNLSLARVFCEQGKFEDAQARLEHAKAHAVRDGFNLARAMDEQARLWDQQGRVGDAKSEALRAIDAFEKLGAADNMETTTRFLHQIEARRPGRPWRFKWRW